MTFKRNNRFQSAMHTLTLVLILCPALLLGCSDKEETIPSEPDKETNIVSSHNVYVGHPFNVYLPEETSGYTVNNNNPEKLRDEYLAYQCIVRLTALCEGESSVHILDKNNKPVKIIEIQAAMWGSKDVEVENGGHPYVKPEVRMEAQDTQTGQKIEKELMQELKDRNGTLYTFDNQTRLFSMTFPDGRKGYEGTYKCDADSLIMQTENIKKKYGYEVSPGRKFLIIHEDRTEEFCERYPDAGVTSVTTQQTWRDQTILDIHPFP